MSTINLTYEEFKVIAKEFFDACNDPGWTTAQIDNGWKCLTIAYLNMTEAERINDAAAIVNLAGQKYLKRMVSC